MDEQIEATIAAIEEEALKVEKPPAMVVMPPDMGQAILGNRGGFLRLAIAALKAAQGHDQTFDKQTWVCHEDADWEIDGLKFDEYAHMHLPEKPTEWKRRRQNAIGLMVGLFLMGCFTIGLITIVHWIFGWPEWP